MCLEVTSQTLALRIGLVAVWTFVRLIRLVRKSVRGQMRLAGKGSVASLKLASIYLLVFLLLLVLFSLRKNFCYMTSAMI